MIPDDTLASTVVALAVGATIVLVGVVFGAIAGTVWAALGMK